MRYLILLTSLCLISLGAFADASAAKGSGYRYQLKSMNPTLAGELSKPVEYSSSRSSPPKGYITDEQRLRPVQFFAPK